MAEQGVHADTHNEKRESFLKRGRYWPLLIVGMLLFHASLMIGTIVVVAARKDMYVEKDYYAKSVEWDQQRELLTTADDLGWEIKASAHVPPTGEDGHRRVVQVVFLDDAGQPIDGALVEAEVYHPAHANDRSDLVLIGEGEGMYQRDLVMENSGYWKVDLSIRYQGVQAIVRKEIEIADL